MPFIDHEPFVDDTCRSPEHLPPGMIVLQPGWHTWECPKCGHQTTFIVRGSGTL